ncbi:MAG: biopolymer transporter ExbD [Acidobacteria bacterium]|nr:biopolymer transporter ExbD [Acidobacteriota bacterium]
MMTPGKKDTRFTGSLSEINVTPLVDVMLVLLIIFMITSPILFQGVEVQLPKTESGDAVQSEKFVISITKDEKVYINRDLIHEKLITEKFEALHNAGVQSVFLRADERVQYGYILKIMDMARKAGIINVSLVTEPLRTK